MWLLLGFLMWWLTSIGAFIFMTNANFGAQTIAEHSQLVQSGEHGKCCTLTSKVLLISHLPLSGVVNLYTLCVQSLLKRKQMNKSDIGAWVQPTAGWGEGGHIAGRARCYGKPAPPLYPSTSALPNGARGINFSLLDPFLKRERK